MPLAQIEGGDIHYEESGAGAVLAILLPQSVGPVGVRPFRDRLAERFRVVRHDERGTGRSAPVAVPEGMTMADRAAELAALFDALGIDRAHLFLPLHRLRRRPVAVRDLPGPGRRAGSRQPVEPRRCASEGDARSARGRRAGRSTRTATPASTPGLLFPPDYRRAHAEAFETLARNAAPQDANRIEDRLEAILAFDARARWRRS